VRKNRSASARWLKRPGAVQAGSSLLIHDLKNLAGRLAVLCQNLHQRYQDPMFKRSALQVLDGTVLHLRRLASDLREHEDRFLVKLRVDLNVVLESALSGIRSPILRKVELLEDYRDLPRIWGDAYLLRCAFACAIENALEAMGGRGTLLIRTALRRRSSLRRIVVEIADTGPGMSRDFLRGPVWQPFVTTKKEGMGLGVYTMRQVAMLHGGTLRILSREQEGTRVRFHFPVEE
jgi:signal transduction histidine kinase